MAASLAYSVLMPVAPWESPDHVDAALESLKWQLEPPAQIVISCDGEPSPALAALLNTFPMPLKIIVGNGGEGVGPVLNRGLVACSCDLVVRADADDISHPERCGIQVAWMAAHQETMALSSLIEEFSAESNSTLCRWVPCEPKRILSFAMRRNPLNHQAVILRRHAVLAVGSYRCCPGFEDYDLWLRLLKYWGPECLANMPKVLVSARVGSAHLSRRHGWSYTRAESSFFMTAARQSLINWHNALVALIVRLPLRLLPSGLLRQVMFIFTRLPQAKN
jgi:glycosyltransferase involved in cell wall biosynthesis